MASSAVMRGASLRVSPFSQASRPSTSRSLVVTVEANKKVQKKTKVRLERKGDNRGL